MSLSRRHVLAGGAAVPLAGQVLAAPALAGERRRWRMVTSWPRDLPGPGVSAARLARAITTLSGGRIEIELFAAGELVPALEVFDAVGGGVAEIAHTASFFWAGKTRAAVYFTTVPFGLTPREHVAWIDFGGGQALWDELYADFGLKPFMGGNSGMNMFGWLQRPLEALSDLRGLRFRIAGIGAEMLQALSAVPVLLPPGEILPALQRGTIDGAEFLGPWSDRASGFYQAARHYHGPSITKPNGTAEAIVNHAAWEELPADLQAVVEHACTAEAARGLAEADWENALALNRLVEEHEVELHELPADIVTAAGEVAADLLADIASESELARRIGASHDAARDHAAPWSEISLAAYLRARGG